ncbi:hypothetical protein FA04_14705 [Ensifer adhaerens]|uniref:DUF4375 domain-containing protein n=2 Tax=Ensifer adhaerens TaxID=106592 RepID=A0ABY8HCS2_ENSAD|nr:hypothetical protein [Ensifer adhaerens]ANK73762.1 hypothetical protein FA04_14705 [Ensifer adhaerens]KDP70277.1 hypothetical protein FA04_28995 [Ensifer adhaerens]WFP89847.1 hypothetical protein P4B07_14935 [Ensifer adhaerens]
MAHTPGPWHLEFGHQQREGGMAYWQVHDGSDAIACNQFCWASNSEANARLIASAPDLLASLNEERRIIGDLVGHASFVEANFQIAYAHLHEAETFLASKGQRFSEAEAA